MREIEGREDGGSSLICCRVLESLSMDASSNRYGDLIYYIIWFAFACASLVSKASENGKACSTHTEAWLGILGMCKCG